MIHIWRNLKSDNFFHPRPFWVKILGICDFLFVNLWFYFSAEMSHEIYFTAQKPWTKCRPPKSRSNSLHRKFSAWGWLIWQCPIKSSLSWAYNWIAGYFNPGLQPLTSTLDFLPRNFQSWTFHFSGVEMSWYK